MVAELTAQINQKLLEWGKGKSKLVVALDGHTGVGKTTILKRLCEINPDIVPVATDDFIIDSETRHKMLAEAEDKSKFFELHNNDYAALEKVVKKFRSGDSPQTIMIVEGVFLFHPKSMDHLWDKRIYLTGDEEIIRDRRVKREKARWGDQYFPETNPDSYFSHVITALKRYQAEHQPEQKADLVINVDHVL